jgi:hypothetical protein
MLNSGSLELAAGFNGSASAWMRGKPVHHDEQVARLD